MTHPLTDEQLEALEIARIEHPLNDLRIYDEIISLELPRPNDDMRAAYDKGAEDRLEQVIEWLKTQTDYSGTFYYEALGDIETIEDALMSAMRPQEES